MTCIVGLVEKNHVLIGADSSSVAGWTVRQTALQKVFRNGPFVIGYTTSFRMGQILQYEVGFPEAKIYDEAYMVTKFIPAVQEKLKDLGYTQIINNRQEGGSFLVGVAGQLFDVADDFQVNHYRDGMAAVGIGAEYAMGALGACRGIDPPDKKIPARDAVSLALRVAAYYSGAVKEPFTILEA